jgi:hypothetical protein
MPAGAIEEWGAAWQERLHEEALAPAAPGETGGAS